MAPLAERSEDVVIDRQARNHIASVALRLLITQATQCAANWARRPMKKRRLPYKPLVDVHSAREVADRVEVVVHQRDSAAARLGCMRRVHVAGHLPGLESAHRRTPGQGHLDRGIVMKSSVALNTHRAALREIVARHGALRPRIFGSAVHGDDTDTSDLDLLVDPTSRTTLMTLAAIQLEAERLLGVPVDVLTPKSLPRRYREQVLREAQPV